MLFYEYSFLFLFLPVALIVYFALPERFRNAWLFLASCVFYSASSWIYLPLLLAAIVVDYYLGLLIFRAASPSSKKKWLAISIVVNLGALAVFKYVGLITATLREIPGFELIPLIAPALPVGISFHTFQSMSYTIELYRNQVKPAKSIIDYGAFVSLYPQLVAGPIVRYHEVHEQLRTRVHSSDKFLNGVFLLTVGLGKKLLLADTFAAVADPLFAAGSPTILQAWTGILLYAGQIYFDFSGYSDMAIGLALMIGFEFPINFNSPYKATSFSDFWRRWHITLSLWLRDNLYVSLGGNRKGPRRTMINLMITMLLGGLWHGASWNFLIWGGLHGAYLAIERLLSGSGRISFAPPVWARRVFVFLLVTIAWVFFRLDQFDQSIAWLSAMFGGAALGGLALRDGALLLFMLLMIWGPPSTSTWKREVTPLRVAFGVACLVAGLIVGYGRGSSPFLYFRF